MYDYMLKVILLRPWWVPNSPHLKAWSPDPSFMFCVLNLKNGPTGKYLLVTFHLVFPGADFVTKVRSQWSQIHCFFSGFGIFCRFEFSKIRKKPLKCDHCDLTLVTKSAPGKTRWIVTNFWILWESKPKMCLISPQNGHIWAYKLKHPI